MEIIGGLMIIIAVVILVAIEIWQSFKIQDLKCTLYFYQKHSNNVKKKLYEDPVYYRGHEDALQDMRNLLNKEEKPAPPTSGSNAVKPKKKVTISTEELEHYEGGTWIL